VMSFRLYRECGGARELGSEINPIAGAFPIRRLVLSRNSFPMGIGYQFARDARDYFCPVGPTITSGMGSPELDCVGESVCRARPTERTSWQRHTAPAVAWRQSVWQRNVAHQDHGTMKNPTLGRDGMAALLPLVGAPSRSPEGTPLCMPGRGTDAGLSPWARQGRAAEVRGSAG